MANTFVAIATVTVGSGGASNIIFSSIPQTYTDLLVKMSFRSSSNGGGSGGSWDNYQIGLNGSGTSFTYRSLLNIDNSAASVNGSVNVIGWMNYAGSTTSTFSSHDIYIPNYTSSNTKPISQDGVVENNSTQVVSGILASLWNSTSAITSISFTPNAGNFAQYSTATLYGIKNS